MDPNDLIASLPPLMRLVDWFVEQRAKAKRRHANRTEKQETAQTTNREVIVSLNTKRSRTVISKSDDERYESETVETSIVTRTVPNQKNTDD